MENNKKISKKTIDLLVSLSVMILLGIGVLLVYVLAIKPLPRKNKHDDIFGNNYTLKKIKESNDSSFLNGNGTAKVTILQETNKKGYVIVVEARDVKVDAPGTLTYEFKFEFVFDKDKKFVKYLFINYGHSDGIYKEKVLENLDKFKNKTTTEILNFTELNAGATKTYNTLIKPTFTEIDKLFKGVK